MHPVLCHEQIDEMIAVLAAFEGKLGRACYVKWHRGIPVPTDRRLDFDLAHRLQDWFQSNANLICTASAEQLEDLKGRVTRLGKLRYIRDLDQRRSQRLKCQHVIQRFRSQIDGQQQKALGASSPLNAAIQALQSRRVADLLSKGHSPNIDQDGKFSLDYATEIMVRARHPDARKRAETIIKLLRTHGAVAASRQSFAARLSFSEQPAATVEPVDIDEEMAQLRDSLAEVSATDAPPKIVMTPGQTRFQRCGHYFIDPCRCSRSECSKNITFCFNRRWLKCTAPRIAGCLCTGGLIGGTTYSYVHFGLDIFTGGFTSLAAFVAVNGFETGMDLISLFMARAPYVERSSPDQLRQWAVVIPVHGREKDIEPTLHSIQQLGVGLDQVFIIENTGGRYSQEESYTFQLLTSRPDYFSVNYRWWGTVGSKVAAEVVGCYWALRQGFTWATTIDDDVLFRPGWDPALNVFVERPHVKCVAYQIEVSNETQNFCTDYQGGQYLAADHVKFWESRIDALAAPHGAVKTVELRQYAETVCRPPVDGRFSVEDGRIGHAFYFDGSPIFMAPGVPVGTEVPDNCATYCSQRLGSWRIGSHNMTCNYLQRFVTEAPRDCTPSELIKFPLRLLSGLLPLWSNASDAARFLMLPGLVLQPTFWYIYAGLAGARCCTQFTRESFCEPHHRREQVCQPAATCKSAALQTLRIGFDVFNQFMGSMACLANYCCAGVAKPEDFPINMRFPEDVRELLDIKEAHVREGSMNRYMDTECPVIARRLPERQSMGDE